LSRFWIFKQGIKIFFFLRFSQDPFRSIIWNGGMGLDEGLEFLAEIGRFPVADGFRAWNQAIVWFADRIVAAVFTDMEIGIAMGARGPEADLYGDPADWFRTVPTEDGYRLHLVNFPLRGRSRLY
jgi:hypothetical protein